MMSYFIDPGRERETRVQGHLQNIIAQEQQGTCLPTVSQVEDQSPSSLCRHAAWIADIANSSVPTAWNSMNTVTNTGIISGLWSYNYWIKEEQHMHFSQLLFTESESYE